MINDNQLDNLLRDYNPATGDGSDLIADLERRMDAVDMVKEYQSRQMAQLRLRAIAALLAGIVIGITFAITAQFMPTTAETLAITTRFNIVNTLIDNLHYILGSLSIILIVYGIYGMTQMREYSHQKASTPQHNMPKMTH